MVRGYLPVINTLAKGLDIRLGHRYLFLKIFSNPLLHFFPDKFPCVLRVDLNMIY